MREDKARPLVSMDLFTPIAVLVVWFMDVSLNSLLEPVLAHISIVILLTCLQVALPMCALVFLFVMFMRTKLLQAGNFSALLYKFRSLFIIAPIYLSLLIAIRAMRIEAYARNMNFAFLWDIPGYFPLFICYRLVAIFFYFCLLRTLMRLGDPHLYVQRAAPEIDEVRTFCQHITERQFRSVPIIIRGATTYESINRAVTLLNQLVADKYQLLALDLREAQALQLSELALASRKRWELQRHQKELLDVCDTDYFSDLDLQMYAELDTEQWREGLQVLSHVNLIQPIKTTRQMTLYSNERRSADVQEWAASSADTLRHKLLSQAFKLPSSKKGGGRSRSLGLETPQGTPGLLASGLRGSLGGGASTRNRAVTFEK